MAIGKPDNSGLRADENNCGHGARAYCVLWSHRQFARDWPICSRSSKVAL